MSNDCIIAEMTLETKDFIVMNIVIGRVVTLSAPYSRTQGGGFPGGEARSLCREAAHSHYYARRATSRNSGHLRSLNAYRLVPDKRDSPRHHAMLQHDTKVVQA